MTTLEPACGAAQPDSDSGALDRILETTGVAARRTCELREWIDDE
jgi:hypothetical protein